MEASRSADCFGCAPGHTVQMADGEQAYIQAELGGNACWICLPPEARPSSWGKYRRPVARLRKALYGHPDSGTMWEKHCDKHVRDAGFDLVGAAWPACYFHKGLHLLLVVYVDDFKLSGPTAFMSPGWKLLRKRFVHRTRTTNR